MSSWILDHYIFKTEKPIKQLLSSNCVKSYYINGEMKWS